MSVYLNVSTSSMFLWFMLVPLQLLGIIVRCVRKLIIIKYNALTFFMYLLKSSLERHIVYINNIETHDVKINHVSLLSDCTSVTT